MSQSYTQTPFHVCSNTLCVPKLRLWETAALDQLTATHAATGKAFTLCCIQVSLIKTQPHTRKANSEDGMLHYM